MITPEDIKHRFTNHPPSTGEVAALLDALTERFIDLGTFLAETLPECRETSLALTNLEQVSMFSKAAVARHQSDIGS